MSVRALAIDVLARVEATDAYLNRVLDARLAESAPDRRDAAFVTELCYGTTRRRLTLDHAFQGLVDRRLETLEDRVLAALRVGAYQIFYTRVPRRAAVGETVEALKSLGFGRAAGLVNAVLRKLAVLEAPPLPPESELVDYLAVRESHPAWLVERWLRHFGRDPCERMLEADNQPPAVTVRINARRTDRSAVERLFQDAGVEAHPTTLSPVGVVLPRAGPVDSLLGFSEGLWQVQDEAAQLVGLFAAIPAGERVLDACAAPGGKACHLAETHPVVAVDVHAGKLPQILAEARRLGVDAQVVVRAHDMTEPLPASLGPFEAVLVDAPCTGLGTLRRHPELRWRRGAEDVARLAVLQARILASAEEQVPAGGLLVYAVCSLEPEEGSDQIEMFLRSHPEFTAEPPPALPGPGWPSWQGFLRTLPGPEGMDGFFAARLRRTY